MTAVRKVNSIFVDDMPEPGGMVRGIWSELQEWCEMMVSDKPLGQICRFEWGDKKVADAATNAVRAWCKQLHPELSAICNVRGGSMWLKFQPRSQYPKPLKPAPIEIRYRELFEAVDTMTPGVPLLWKKFENLKDAESGQSAVCNRLSARRGQGTYETHIIRANSMNPKNSLYVELLEKA